ncbi:hypothetical protein PHET_02430 [Paragonimus heterotremus]|uniref:Uncharacterized protein n=1 Tax=Paragonimus heterotremus TaxID=100268 RepID=A0A8J4WIM5_9TREM|nr:hypothetical protein PHET_02430 [Paragonimus heterotremus]
MTTYFSDAQIQELSDAFNLHNPRGYLNSLQDVQLSLRYVGCVATLDDIAELYSGDPMDFPAFLDLYSKLLSLPTDLEKVTAGDLLDLLKQHLGHDLTVDDWLCILTKFGDKIESTAGNVFYDTIQQTELCSLLRSTLECTQ